MGSQIIHVLTIDNIYALYACRTLLPWLRCGYSGTHEIPLFEILDWMGSQIIIRAFHARMIRHTKIRTEITVTYLFWTEIKCSGLYQSNPYEATVCVAEAHGQVSCRQRAINYKGFMRKVGFLLWSVAVRCSALQCVADSRCARQSVVVCCSVLQCGAVWCGVLQRVAVCCSVLQMLTIYCES